MSNAFGPGPKIDPGTTYGGMDGNLAALLGYLFFPLAIVALCMERANKFVRFHSIQSLALVILCFIGNIILGFIPILGCILVPLFDVLTLVLIIMLMIKSYQCEMYHVPVLGDFLEKQFGQYM